VLCSGNVLNVNPAVSQGSVMELLLPKALQVCSRLRLCFLLPMNSCGVCYMWISLQVSSGDEAARASERSNKQLEAAVMRQRLSALQQQQDSLLQQLSALPPEQQQLVLLHQQQLQQQMQQQAAARAQRGGRSRRGGRRGSSSGRGRQGAAAAAAAAGQQFAPGQESDAGDTVDDSGVRMALVETERDRLIRCGLLTPFDKLEGFEMRVQGGTGAAPQTAQQQQQQQQQQQGNVLPRTASRPPPRGSSVVDEQWALLSRNAVPASAAAASIPADLADMANQVGRGGLPLSDLLAKAAQQTLEAGVTHRSRAILLEAGEVSCGCRHTLSGAVLAWLTHKQPQ
jgi:hypothetical protein